MDLERIMLNFIKKFSILYDFQFGFRNKFATHLALITLVDRITSALKLKLKLKLIYLPVPFVQTR